jgi:hypothetical protein
LFALYPERDEAVGKGRSHNRALPLKRFRFTEWLTDGMAPWLSSFAFSRRSFALFPVTLKYSGKGGLPRAFTMVQGSSFMLVFPLRSEQFSLDKSIKVIGFRKCLSCNRVDCWE